MSSINTNCLDLIQCGQRNLIMKPNTQLQQIRGQRSCLVGIPLKILDMRRKAEVLQYKKNSFNWTKLQKYAYLAKHPIGINEQLPKLSISQINRFNAGLYLPPTRTLVCDSFLHSSKFILNTGDNGLIKSSHSASNVPNMSKSEYLYYDSSIPLTNWKSQIKFNEAPILEINDCIKPNIQILEAIF